MARRYFKTGARSTAFTPGRRARSYRLADVDAGFWRQVQRRCRDDGISVRAKILSLLKAWLEQA